MVDVEAPSPFDVSELIPSNRYLVWGIIRMTLEIAAETFNCDSLDAGICCTSFLQMADIL